MNNISGMPVVERDGVVIGIVTEDDILGAFVDGIQLDLLVVQGIMSTDPITVDIETPLTEVMQTIYDEGVLRVPVVEDGRLVGIISRSDVITALAQPGYLGDSEFPVFHRQYDDSSNRKKRAPAPEHMVPTHGW
jgi:predicted transcriptional regulator